MISEVVYISKHGLDTEHDIAEYYRSIGYTVIKTYDNSLETHKTFVDTIYNFRNEKPWTKKIYDHASNIFAIRLSKQYKPNSISNKYDPLEQDRKREYHEKFVNNNFDYPDVMRGYPDFFAFKHKQDMFFIEVKKWGNMFQHNQRRFIEYFNPTIKLVYICPSGTSNIEIINRKIENTKRNEKLDNIFANMMYRNDRKYYAER